MPSFIAYSLGAVWFAALVMIVIMVHNRHWFVPEHNPETIAEYSILLKPDQISALSSDVSKWLAELEYPASLRSKAALVTEDCMYLIAQHNSNEEAHADITFKRRDSDVLITVIEDGSPYNPIADPIGGDLDAPGTLATIIVLGFAANAEYDRVLDLNFLTLLMKPAAAFRTDQDKEAQDVPSL